MRQIVLPANIAPGSPEAVAFIESQMPMIAVDDPEAPPLEEMPPGSPASHDAALDLIIGGLEQMLDGFKELRNA